jgi:hypothetical protein
MPAKRRTLDRQRRPPISPEAVRLWKLCLEIEVERATERWETDRPPGRRREYLDVHRALATACGLDWCSCIGPTDAKSATLPASLRHRDLQAEAYRAAYRARLALIEAEAAADREAAAAK